MKLNNLAPLQLLMSLPNLSDTFKSGTYYSREVSELTTVLDSFKKSGMKVPYIRLIPDGHVYVVTDYYTPTHTDDHIRTISPLDDDFIDVFHAVQMYRDELITTMHRIRETGYIPSDIHARAIDAAYANRCFEINNGDVEYNPHRTYRTLTEGLDVSCYLTIPSMQIRSKLLMYNRDCETCGSVFFYKLDNARFCSERCRGITGRQRRAAAMIKAL